MASRRVVRHGPSRSRTWPVLVLLLVLASTVAAWVMPQTPSLAGAVTVGDFAITLGPLPHFGALQAGSQTSPATDLAGSPGVGSVSSLPAGSNPCGIGFDSSNGELYVADTIGGTNVTVLDGTSGATVASIATGQANPYAVAFDSSNKDVYVSDANGAATDLARIDGATNTFVGSLSVGINPHGVVYDSANHDLYVANLYSNNVSVIDARSGTAVASIPTGFKPDAIAFDPRNDFVYVSLDSFGGVDVINGSSNSVVGSISTGAMYSNGPCYGSGITVDPANGDVYVADDGADNVVAIDGATNTVVGSIPVGLAPFGVTYDPVDGDLFVSNVNSDNVSIISPSAGIAVGSVAVGSSPAGIAADTITGSVWVANEGSNNVSEISISQTFSAPYRGVPWQSGYANASSSCYHLSYPVLSTFEPATGLYHGSLKESVTSCGSSTMTAQAGVYGGLYLGDEFSVPNGTYRVTVHWMLKFSVRLTVKVGGSGQSAEAGAEMATFAFVDDLTNGTSQFLAENSTVFGATGSHGYKSQVTLSSELELVAGHTYQVYTYTRISVFLSAGPGKSSASAEINMGSDGNYGNLTSVVLPDIGGSG
jgi:YVTN family beta-propeller protein